VRVGRSVKTQLSKQRNLLVRRWHVSAVLGHLQVIKLFTINCSICICFSSLLLIVNTFMTWRWPSTAETCRHRWTNKLRCLDSCVLTDLPTLICTKHNGDDKPEDTIVVFAGREGLEEKSRFLHVNVQTHYCDVAWGLCHDHHKICSLRAPPE
jgi:hypothetical protein